MKRYLLTISYDGTNYSGWQSQNNGTTIQNIIEDSIFKITSKKVTLFASGRTDAGVSALNQKAHFDIEEELNKNKFLKSVNAVLPQDIVIKEICLVDNNFHARYNVKKKTYSYTINLGIKDVFNDKFELHFPYKLNIKNIKRASRYLVGTHDFSSFCSSKTGVKDFNRTIYYIKVKLKSNKLNIKICGNGFLYNMVRIIVGTLLEIGQGKKRVEDIKSILKSKDRKNAGKTVDAKALLLYNVEY